MDCPFTGCTQSSATTIGYYREARDHYMDWHGGETDLYLRLEEAATKYKYKVYAQCFVEGCKEANYTLAEWRTHFDEVHSMEAGQCIENYDEAARDTYLKPDPPRVAGKR